MPLPPGTKLDRDHKIDLNLIKAMAHPDRYLALHILNERVASPNELANEIGTPIGRLAYHVRELEKFGCIELIETKSRRGATEHFYRATRPAFFDGDEWVRVPPSLRESITSRYLEMAGERIAKALAEGTFEARPDRHQSWTPMIVDERGWTEAMGVLAETLDKLLAIQAASSERLGESREPAIPMAVAMMGFEATSSLVSDGAAGPGRSLAE